LGREKRSGATLAAAAPTLVDVCDVSATLITRIVNVNVISLRDTPKSYADFDSGVATQFVLDPHGLLKKSALKLTLAWENPAIKSGASPSSHG
jgi:hypothetical protein